MEGLDDMFICEEIEKAVWGCGNDKAPSPDGFTFGFFKKYWEVVKDDMERLVWCFQDRKGIPR